MMQFHGTCDPRHFGFDLNVIARSKHLGAMPVFKFHLLWQFQTMLSVMRLFLVLIAASATTAHGQTIERACVKSERGAGQQRGLCNCIQGAADRTLSRRDQNLAADFFRDPDLAQRVRRSDRKRDEAFWERYEVFGEVAKRSCRDLS